MAIPFQEIKMAGLAEEIYTHVTPDGVHVLHFALTRMRKSMKVKLVPTQWFPVDYRVGISILEMNAVNPTKIAELMKKTPISYTPILLMAHHDGSSSILDGWEEYCACAANQHPRVLGKRLPMSVWQEFTVEGVPYTDEQLKNFINTQKIHNKARLN